MKETYSDWVIRRLKEDFAALPTIEEWAGMTVMQRLNFRLEYLTQRAERDAGWDLLKRNNSTQ